MKIPLIALAVLTGLFSSLSYAEEVQSVDLQEGQTYRVNVPTCKPGYYGAIGTDEFISEESGQFKGESMNFHQTMTARCLPKTCTYTFSIVNGWLGAPDGTITLYPDHKVLASPNSKEELYSDLQKFVEEGVCVKTGRVSSQI